MRILVQLAGVLTLILALSPSLAAAGFEAGVARADLTPPLSMQATLGGYGERLGRPATGVHDRILAKALVLRAGETRVALVTADVLGFPPPVKAAVLEELEGWTSEQIVLLPSHSHTSLDLSALNPLNDLGNVRIGVFHREVYERTVKLLAEVIRDAAQQMVSVRLGTGSTNLNGFNRNRRARGGIVDRELTLTRVDRASGEPLAVLVNWTAHPTFLGAGDMMFSAGWPGHLQRALEALIGRGVTVLYYNGAVGDQSPLGPGGGGSGWERAEVYGRDLAIQARGLWERIDSVATGTLKVHVEPIVLPRRTWHPDFLKTGGTEYGLTEDSVKVLLEKLAPERTHSVSVRAGDLLIVGVPGEMAAGLGLEIKARAREATGAKHVTIGGLADEWVSYILQEGEYAKGGYEASMSFYGPGLADAIVEGALRGAAGE